MLYDVRNPVLLPWYEEHPERFVPVEAEKEPDAQTLPRPAAKRNRKKT